MNWFDCLDTFSRIAEKQSFIGAARDLKTTRSVISKRIQWLEAELGMSLLLRTTRKVSLTENGEILLSEVKPLLEEWDNVHSRLQDFQAEPRGTLSICLPPNVASTPCMLAAINTFAKSYPLVRIKSMTTHAPISLIDNHIDVLLAADKFVLEPDSTIGTTLYSYEYICVASPEYLKNSPKIKNPEDLRQHNCLVFSIYNEWLFDGNLIQVCGNFGSDSSDALVHSALQGYGLIYIPAFMIKGLLTEKKLVPVLEKHKTKTDILKAFQTQRAYKPRKITAFIEHIKENLKPCNKKGETIN
jgi:DNA-binding transcriptional LysR family regulator